MKKQLFSLKIAKKLLSTVLAAALAITSPKIPGVVLAETAAAETKTGGTELTKEQVDALCETDSSVKQAVHDPSIVVAYTDATKGSKPTNVTAEKTDKCSQKIYFVFGTQLGAAYTYDLENWTAFTPTFYEEGTTNITTDYYKAFKTSADWANQKTSDTVHGNLWAADLIWNQYLNKWCMYYSVNGDALRSSMVLMTADNIFGPYGYADTIVYGGMKKNETDAGALANYKKATGKESCSIAYNTNTSNYNSGVSCIDPCTFWDKNGDLWMAYGSWSGGIYLMKLDKNTGLRDYSYTYKDTDADMKALLQSYGASNNGSVSNSTTIYYDEYLGIHIAGGFYVSGEGPYIRYMNGYYYLFMSYGFYSPTGGYNMRVFRAENPQGPYVDSYGNNAVYTGKGDNFRYNSRGMFLVNNYQWNTMDMAEIALGHNSFFEDTDGNAYVICHTKFADGTAGHELRVMQLYYNENDWLVAAPYYYNQELDTLKTTDIEKTTFSSDDIAGTYDMIMHLTNNYGAKDDGTVAANVKMPTLQEIVLDDKGNISGECTGTWEEKAGTLYATLVINGDTFHGVFTEQTVTGTTAKTVCFTAVNEANGQAVWGSRHFSDAAAVAYNANVKKVMIPDEVTTNLTWNTKTYMGVEITWSSSNTNVISNEGTVTRQEKDTDVVITRTITKGDYVYNQKFPVTVLGTDTQSDALMYYQSLQPGERISPVGIINANTGVSITFTETGINSDWTEVFQTDQAEHVMLSILNYGGENIFEGAAVLSEEAVNLGYHSGNAWTIFNDAAGTHEVTISYNAYISFHHSNWGQ